MKSAQDLALILSRFFALLFFLFHPGFSSFAQSSYADSLLRVISDQPDNSAKADNYVKLARHFIMSKPDSSWFYCEKAVALAEKLNYPVAIADIMSYKSLILKGKGRLQEAADFNEKFINIADSIHDSARMAKGYYNLGLLESEQVEKDKALVHFNKSLDLYLNLKDTNGIIRNYKSIGYIYSHASNYDSAAIYFLKALNVAEKSGEAQYLGMTLTSLSEVYLQLNQLETAMKYASRSLEINQKSNNARAIASDYIMLGRIASENNDFPEALQNYKQAEAIYRQINDPLDIGALEIDMGVIYHKQKEFDKAIQCFNKALDNYRIRNDSRGIIVALGNKAAALSDQGRYAEALVLHDTVRALSERFDYKDYKKDAYWNISDIYNKSGNYQKAYDYVLKYLYLNDTVYTLEKTKMINDLTFKYEKEKDQAQILTLEKENLQKDLNLRKRTSQRNAYFFTGLAVIAVAVFMLIYFRQKTIHDRIIADQKIRQLEEEKKLMSAKLLVEGQEEERKRIATELHDGLGVLLSATKMQFSTIIDKSPENRETIEKAYKMLEQASGDVRKISHNMMPGLLTKLGFYEAVEDLFENIDESAKLTATCTITGNQENRLPENKEIMLYRIVQEMTNNTLKHAGAKNIRLDINIGPGRLDLVYTDDGKGFDFAGKIDTGSLGLKSIQSRVSFLNGELNVESRAGAGVKYTVGVPV